ncbi:glycoside hydrolase [Aureobasidium sp. EXF-3400]|nr:glycoside hydrolase [Aureobasidium sp. EXF-12344]KAI4782373.1 glycoside hydrolase [Aureobasidium sp. EXF-3400]
MCSTVVAVAGLASKKQDNIESQPYTRLDALQIDALHFPPRRADHGETWKTWLRAHGVQSYSGLLYNHGSRVLEPNSICPFASIYRCTRWSKQRRLKQIEREPNFLSPIQSARISAVAAAFQHAWDGYSKHCFGHDTLHPVTNTCEDDFGGYGATAIDSLPTAIIFGNRNVTVQILEFIAALDFKVVKGGSRIQVFEVTIRHCAAMISAWDLLNGPFSHMVDSPDLMRALYAQMITLGDALSCAFDSPSGVPREWVDPASCQSDKGTQNTIAGAGTMILEFARLSDITGNPKYANLAQKAEDYLLKPQPASGESYPGLLGSFIGVEDGKIIGSQGSWGALSDSFYDDLYGLYLERWLIAADSTIRFIGSHPYGHPEWTLLPFWNGPILQNQMESLSWFAGGNFIRGGMVTNNQTLVDYGLSIADAAGAIYNSTQTGLGGEFVTWDTNCEVSENDSCDSINSFHISDGRFRLRPEVLETWYYAYRATKNEKYRDWSWAAFEAINRYCRTDSGFSSLTNVDAAKGGSKGDVQESFVFAEVMKYVYLYHWEVKYCKLRTASYILIADIIRMHRTMFKIAGLGSRTHGCSTRRHIRCVSLVRRDERGAIVFSFSNKTLMGARPGTWLRQYRTVSCVWNWPRLPEGIRLQPTLTIPIRDPSSLPTNHLPIEQQNKKHKTYSSRDSYVVTHRSTNLPFNCLCMAERTGCPVFS